MLLLALHICLVTAFSIRILLRDDLEANSRLAWFVVLLLFPYFGTVIYWLFGENNISKRGTEKYRAVFAKMRNDYPRFISSIQQKGCAGYFPRLFVGQSQCVQIAGCGLRVIHPFAQQRRTVNHVDGQFSESVFIREVAP